MAGNPKTDLTKPVSAAAKMKKMVSVTKKRTVSATKVYAATKMIIAKKNKKRKKKKTVGGGMVKVAAAAWVAAVSANRKSAGKALVAAVAKTVASAFCNLESTSSAKGRTRRRL